MVNIGIDIIEIERINKAMEKKNFLKRIFTESEIEYIIKKGNKAETVAGLFAAKEAVSKVLGTGISKISWTDIEVQHEKSGKPTIELKNNAKIIALDNGIKKVMISISHCKTYAVANAFGE